MDEELLMLPGPTNVPEDIRREESKPMINHRGKAFQELYDRIQNGLKYVFQTEKTVYVLTASGTGAVECAISNLVKRGDKVLVPTNGEFGIRLADMFQIYGAEVVRIPSEWGDWADPQIVEDALIKNSDCAILAFVYNETSTGVRNPAKQLVEIGKKHGALVLCDSISNLGGDEMYTDKWGVDIAVSGSQKCLACPPGLSFITLNEKAWGKVEDSKPHNNYYWDLEKMKKFHERRETPFTPAVSLFYALNQALNIIVNEGIERRVIRHQICSKALREGAKAIGFKLFAKKEDYASATVNAFNLPLNISDREIKDYLLDKYGIAVSGGIGPTKGQIIRIGTMGTVDKTQVTATLRALEEYLIGKEAGIRKGAAEEAASAIFSRSPY